VEAAATQIAQPMAGKLGSSTPQIVPAPPPAAAAAMSRRPKRRRERSRALMA